MGLLRYIYIVFLVALFLAVLGFASRNSALVTVNYYLGLSWSAPLVVLLLVALGTGVALGVVACFGLVVRQRRQINALKRELNQLHS